MIEVTVSCIVLWFALQIITLFLFSSIVKHSKQKKIKNGKRNN